MLGVDMYLVGNKQLVKPAFGHNLAVLWSPT